MVGDAKLADGDTEEHDQQALMHPKCRQVGKGSDDHAQFDTCLSVQLPRGKAGQRTIEKSCMLARLNGVSAVEPSPSAAQAHRLRSGAAIQYSDHLDGRQRSNQCNIQKSSFLGDFWILLQNCRFLGFWPQQYVQYIYI